jgi:hypothetical protein
VFGKMVWRRLFVPWREAGMESCSDLHNEEFHVFYPLPKMIRLIIDENELGRVFIIYGRVEKCMQRFHWKT